MHNTLTNDTLINSSALTLWFKRYVFKITVFVTIVLLMENAFWQHVSDTKLWYLSPLFLYLSY